MNTITQKEFSDLCDVKRQTIQTMIKRGDLDTVKVGKINKINMDGVKTRRYLATRQYKSENLPSTEFDTNSPEEAAVKYIVERARLQEAKRIDQELKNAKFRGKLLDYELVDTYVFLYLDKVHDNLKRLGNSYLDDTGMKIVKSGKVTNKIREDWNNSINGIIFDAIEDIKKRIQEIQEQQQK